MTLNLRILIRSWVVLLISFSIVIGADNKSPRTTFRLDRAPKLMIPVEMAAKKNSTDKDGVQLALSDRPPTVSPGITIGLTNHDLQHFGSMGRQIAGNTVCEYILIVWTGQFDFYMPGDQRIYGQAWDISSDAYTGDPCISCPDFAGYPTCSWQDGNVADMVCQVDFGSGFNDIGYYYDALPCNLVFIGTVLETDPEEFGFPMLENHDGSSPGVTDDMTYVLAHNLTGTDDIILYRKPGGGSWDAGTYITTGSLISHVIAADPHSDNVAIAYTDDRLELAEGEGGQIDLDVWYKISTDQGATWSDAICISNYTEDSLWRAYADVSCAFSHDGVFHAVWPARELRDVNCYELYKCRLVHWDNMNQKASVIDEARYQMLFGGRLCDPGDWNMYIAKPSISVCEDKLYTLYTKFGDDNEPGALFDCSQLHFANGELYLAASDDNGLSWDTAWNLTRSRTPMCDSSECESDHWPSMARYGYPHGDEADRDTLDIMYINDKDAGAIVLGEGTWCINNVMHYRFPCRDVNHIPRISISPRAIDDPVHTPPAVPLAMALKLENVGNAALNISNISINYIDGGPPDWIALGSYYTPIPISNFTELVITLNAGAVLSGAPDPSGWNAEIIVESDAPTSPDVVPVFLTIASDFNLPECDTLETGSKKSAASRKLLVSNTGRLGDNIDGLSLDIAGDCDADLMQPNGDMYLAYASPMIAWNDGSQNLAYTTIFSQYFTEDGTFRPQSPLIITSEADYNRAVCTITTSDSLFAVDVALYAPTDGNDFIIGRYDFRVWPGPKGMDEVYVGMILDWDIPSDEDVDNGSGHSELLNTVWQRGAQTNTDDENPPHSCPIYEDDRYGGIALLLDAPRNAWTAPHDQMQFGTGLHPDSLFNRMSNTIGYDLYSDPDEDSVVDLHTGVTFDLVDMSMGETYSYIFALVTTNQGLSDYENQVASVPDWAAAHGIIIGDTCEEQTPGDANGDGNISSGDMAFILSFLCSGGPAPVVLANGDPNGDCIIDTLDVIYLAQYIFQGGPPPVECTCVGPAIGPCGSTSLCDNSWSDPAFVVCPAGDAPFRVYLRDEYGDSVVGDNSTWIEFLSCSSIDPCPGSQPFTTLYPVGSSDENGVVTFYMDGGDCDNYCTARIHLADCTLGDVPVKALDVTGDHIVSFSNDYDFTMCNDYNNDGLINFNDDNIFSPHVGHSCEPIDPCELFGYEFTLDPESNLTPGQEIDLILAISNNNVEASCYIGSIGFFYSEFGAGIDDTLITSVHFDSTLGPGEQAIVSVDYQIPESGHGCVISRFTTDCCSTAVEIDRCFQSTLLCKPDSNVCVEFQIILNSLYDSIYDAQTQYYPPADPTGWSFVPGSMPTFPLYGTVDYVDYMICTPQLNDLGDSASVIVTLCLNPECTEIERFESRVVFSSQAGDVNYDCSINVADAVYLINYIFKDGPAPVPVYAGDANCSAQVDVGDAVYIINYVFKAGPPPCLVE